MAKIDLSGSIAKVAESVKNITIIVGIVVAVFGLYKSHRDLVIAARSQKLSTYGTVKELIKAGEEQRENINVVAQNKQLIPEMVKKYGDVSRFFYESNEPVAKAIASVGHHYEQLGALVRLGYFDFDLFYEVVPFPDDFWEATAPVRDEAHSNWSWGTGLPDFWKNFEELKKRYDDQRKIDRETAARRLKAH